MLKDILKESWAIQELVQEVAQETVQEAVQEAVQETREEQRKHTLQSQRQTLLAFMVSLGCHRLCQYCSSWI